MCVLKSKSCSYRCCIFQLIHFQLLTMRIYAAKECLLWSDIVYACYEIVYSLTFAISIIEKDLTKYRTLTINAQLQSFSNNNLNACMWLKIKFIGQNLLLLDKHNYAALSNSNSLKSCRFVRTSYMYHTLMAE